MEIDSSLKQPLSPTRPHHQDNDLNSEDDDRVRKTKALPPIGLSKDELNQRLNTLKDYQTYKNTKAKRINLETIHHLEQTPVVSTALAFGTKQRQNEVLLDFIQNQATGEANPQDSNIFQQLLKDSHHHKPKIKHEKEPSFISYKSTEQQQKNKIKTILTSSSIEQSNQKQRKRCITESKKSKPQKKRIILFPKELKNLKNKLKHLPIVGQQYENVAGEPIPPLQRYKTQAQEGITLSINSKDNHQPSNYPKISCPKGTKEQEQKMGARSVDYRRKRKEYMSSIRTIIDKSGNLLNNKEELLASKRKYSMVSQQESLLVSSNKTSVSPLKEKAVGYWPSYPQYSISQQDLKKLKKLSEASSHIPDCPAISESISQLDRIIKQQISLQHSSLNHDLIHKDHDVSNRFAYLMELQRQNYKRNVKELLKCKKAYYLQKQREEIRANGIKRMKKMGDREVLKNKPVQQVQSEEL